MLMCLVSKNKHLFVSIQGMSFGGMIKVCCHVLMCLVSEDTKLLVNILGTLVGALILDALLLYGIRSASSYYFVQFYWILHNGWISDI
jgi:hypothetical protein